MTTAIEINKIVPVEIGTYGKFKLTDDKGEEHLVNIKEVPAIRMKFTNSEFHDDNTIAFMKELRSKFKCSVIIADIKMGSTDEEIKEAVEAIINIKSKVAKVAIIVHIDVFDTLAVSLNLEEKYLTALNSLVNSANEPLYDRLMLDDHSMSIMVTTVPKIKQNILNTVNTLKDISNIGICNSYLTSDDACLTAIICRELEAKYGDTLDMAIPTANHNGCNGGCCGCIRTTKCVGAIKAENPKTSGKIVEHKVNEIQLEYDENGNIINEKNEKKKPVVKKQLPKGTLKSWGIH